MLTKQQKRLLEYISHEMYQTGICPSYDEMRDALELKSKSGIHRIIGSLEERGFIRKLPNRARALEILKTVDDYKPNAPGSANESTNISPKLSMLPPLPTADSTATVNNPPSYKDMESAEIPMLGKIAAGTPIESITTPDYFVGFPMSMLGGAEEHYSLQVDGDSMVDVGIFDGDTVLIEKCNSARDGDVVVALIDREEATLKTLFRKNNAIHLQPENDNHKTQVYSPDRVEIQGRLIGLLRKY